MKDADNTKDEQAPNEVPVTATEPEPVVMGQETAVMETEPAVMGQEPAVMETAPAVMETAPAVMGQETAVMGQEPAVMETYHGEECSHRVGQDLSVDHIGVVKPEHINHGPGDKPEVRKYHQRQLETTERKLRRLKAIEDGKKV